MKPEDIGYTSNKLILGKHSGRNALNDRLVALGVNVPQDRLDVIFSKFKALADKKKNIYDEDLILMAMDYDIDKKYELVAAHIVSDMGEISKAKVEMKIDGKIVSAEAEGDGPVSALYSGVVQLTGLKGHLTNFSVTALTPDMEAVGLVKIEWQDSDGNTWYGHASDTDIVVAAGKSLVDLLNRIEIRKLHEMNRLKI
jgi:2-isopropylmalate synthase